MCTYLAINTSSMQLIPATAIAILAANHRTNPTAIVGTSIMATTCAARRGGDRGQTPPAPADLPPAAACAVPLRVPARRTGRGRQPANGGE